MPVTRIRKTQSSEESKQSTSAASQKAISHYGRVTKNQKANQSIKRSKTLLDEAIRVLSAQDTHDNETREEHIAQQPEAAVQAPEETDNQRTARVSRKRRHDEPAQTPQHKRFKNAIPPTPAETPSKAVSHLFDRLDIDARVKDTIAEEPIAYDTPPLTPKPAAADLSASKPITQLPAELKDLLRLFSAFITSTSLFYAHHGSGTPLQMAFILQNVTKVWKKRAVTDVDIRKILAILNDANFEIVDNGDDMICLEQVGNLAPGHFNQPVQRQRFEDHLTKLWDDWVSISSTRKHDVAVFINQLPLAEIVEGDFAPSKHSQPSKGQSRLDDIKSIAIKARSDDIAAQKPAVSAQGKTSSGVSSRGSSLLDRILAKEQLQSSKGGGPTQEELNRRAALNRIEDIVPVLDLLAGSRPRVSFSTQTMVSNLQNSLRNPISREEVERCLALMASEVAPAFVSMISAGHVKGIVITKGGRPSNADLRSKLERAGGSFA